MPQDRAEVDALRAMLRKLDGYMMGALDCRVSAAGWHGIVTNWRKEIAEDLAAQGIEARSGETVKQDSTRRAKARSRSDAPKAKPRAPQSSAEE